MIATTSPLQDVLESVVAMRAIGGAPLGLAVVELTLGPGLMTPLHVHEQEEAVRVLEGSLVVHTASDDVALTPGDAFVAEGAVPHAMSAGAYGTRYLIASYTRSAAHYAEFVRVAAVPQPRSRGPRVPEDERALAFVAKANGIVVLGPPGALVPSASVAA